MAEQRYTIHEQLGAGGNGAVFRAFDTQLKRWVAIKRLLSAEEAASSNPDAEELRREADTLASLRNANIVTIFDVAQDSEGLFMVMELLEGPDLADTIAHGPLMFDDFKQLAEQTLEALLAAHNLRILHRDIKPENIKVERLAGGRLQAKIIDFGLARTGIAARKQTEDHEGSVMGSIYYMAPEQLSREPTGVHTDLYALGCVFYETLAGRKPFDGKSVNEVIDKHLDHDVVPLHQICPHLPQWLTYWVMRLMAQKPEDRPATAQQAIEEFRAWEKLPPMPGMMPWMPHGYGYAAPMPYVNPMPVHGYTGQVPVQTGGFYPPHITSSSVPVQPQPGSMPVPLTPQSAPVPVQPMPAEAPGVPVAAVAPTQQRPAGPQRASPGVQRPGSARIPSASSASQKKWLIIGGGAVAAIIVLALMLKGPGKGGSGSKGAGAEPVAVRFSPGPVREDLYPNDRNFPIPENLRVAHYMARAATQPYSAGSSKPAEIGVGNPIAVVNDMSKRGGNTPLVGSGFQPDASPQRAAWSTDDGAIRGGRDVLDFKKRGGSLISMKIVNAEAAKDDFPFGKPPPLPANPGLTLAIVFQADPASLPCRILKLSGAGGRPAITLSVNDKRQVEFESSGTKITSSNVDATRPGLAILTWDGTTSAIELRTRDHRGVNNKATGKLPHPTTALYDLEIGGGENGFGGKLAELVLFAATLREDQVVLLDKDMREHYFNAPKADSLNPTGNKQLASWRVGEEKTIFNGRDLNGWALNSRWWSVKDGALTNQGNPSINDPGQVYAYWKDGTVGDFELTLKVKISGANSGIFYRANVKPSDSGGPRLAGYQAEIEADAKKSDRFGALLETDGRGEFGKVGTKVTIGDHADAKQKKLNAQDGALGDAATLLGKFNPGTWNDYRIVAEGGHIQHFINGKLVLDATDEGHGRNKEGVIGLEGSARGRGVVQFRDITLKRLR